MSNAQKLSQAVAGGADPVKTDVAQSWTANQTLSDYQLIRAMFKDQGYAVVDKGNINNATVTFDYSAGSVQTYTATGSQESTEMTGQLPRGIRNNNPGNIREAKGDQR